MRRAIAGAAIAAALAAAIGTHDGLRILPIHDKSFTGVIVGNAGWGFAAGHGVLDGWVLMDGRLN